MGIEQIYKQFMREHDTDTVEAERALASADDDPEQFELIADGLISKHKTGFIAGFRVAMQLMREVGA